MTRKNLLEGKKILIVDDEPDVLETLEEFLTMCIVSKAATFDAAKNLLETRDFDLAILDIMGVKGYELLDGRAAYMSGLAWKIAIKFRVTSSGVFSEVIICGKRR
jgi:CheY-like chemotaxis protein